MQDQDNKADRLKQKHRDEYKRTRDAVQLLANDANMQIVLRHLAKICGFYIPSRILSPSNEINPYATIYNDGRRSVYLDIRRMLTDEQRRLTESKQEEANVDQNEAV